uniref:Uncharacterized protein n=1 Tax=Arundo donax TaxID=35708 RepID=A0A0A8Y3J8_ARUDO
MEQTKPGITTNNKTGTKQETKKTQKKRGKELNPTAGQRPRRTNTNETQELSKRTQSEEMQTTAQEEENQGERNRRRQQSLPKKKGNDETKEGSRLPTEETRKGGPTQLHAVPKKKGPSI